MASTTPCKRGGRRKPGEKDADWYSVGDACKLLGSLFTIPPSRGCPRTAAGAATSSAKVRAAPSAFNLPLDDPCSFPLLCEVLGKASSAASRRQSTDHTRPWVHVVCATGCRRTATGAAETAFILPLDDSCSFPSLREVEAAAAVETLSKVKAEVEVEVAAVVETLSGNVVKELAPMHLIGNVWDIKSRLVEHALVAEERQMLLHGTDILSNSSMLLPCARAFDQSAKKGGAQRHRTTDRLTLVIKADVPTVKVPDECGSIAEAADKLSFTGGIIELTDSPLVRQEEVYIQRLDISIVALPRDGVDVLGAKLHFLRPMHITYPVKQARLRGLRGLGCVEVDVRSRSWTLLLEHCDIARNGLNYPIVQLQSGVVQCSCLSMCNPRSMFLAVDIHARGLCSVILQDCAIFGEQRGIWLVEGANGLPREALLRERSRGKTQKCIAEWPRGARLEPNFFSAAHHLR